MDAHVAETGLQSLLEHAAGFAVYRLAVDASHPYGARVLMVSPSLTEIIGVADLDRLETWFQNLHPEDQDRVFAANKRAVERGVVNCAHCDQYVCDTLAKFFEMAAHARETLDQIRETL